MSMSDKKFPIIWTIWIVAVVVSFATFEIWASVTGGTTLSRYVWELSKEFPPLPFALGALGVWFCIHIYLYKLPGSKG